MDSVDREHTFRHQRDHHFGPHRPQQRRKGPQIVEAKRGEPLKVVKPYTEEVRREIDWELVDHGIDFVKRQKTAAKPFFLYLPISRTHFPNLPSKRFEGASRIGQFGDSLMEGDAIVGKMLDSLKELGLEKDTIVVFASDNGPDGPGARTFAMDMQDIGSSGPFRGALGDVSEGSIRTAAITGCATSRTELSRPY
jgi:arylsulfatase A-like enzyme